MRKPLLCVVLLGAVVALSVPAAASARGAARPKQYVVLYEKGVSAKSARAAIRAAGGRIVHENRAVTNLCAAADAGPAAQGDATPELGIGAHHHVWFDHRRGRGSAG